ncbi:phosphotransferase [Nonomuraea sediminis]|uniref:phosphotransferase n=1 Tax=Nonomuraea sediminis TaxID=2835864 RepID=UPI001BDD2AF2|nr:phosphotransferase [Nonomuraea sediminis]
MELIGRGRTAEVFALSRTRVLRRYHENTSAADEARIMGYVRERGYPVPEVYDATERDLVMERLHGPTMVDVLTRAPWRVGPLGRLLGSLHDRLGAIPAPGWLRQSLVPGDRMLHLDLHPLNVVMTPDGPSVIDWCNARAGEPAFDLATTVALLRTAEAPNLVARLGRRLLIGAILRGSRTDHRPWLGEAVKQRLSDPNITAEEKERLRRLAG